MLGIDPKSPVPPFEQLRQRLMQQITSGELTAGSRLPTVRRLAEDLGIAPNTVARCYRELEASGAIETRGRNGTVVAWSADSADREIEQAARGFADRVRALGGDPTRALELARAALAGA
ncbi:GntR family transcriptional regulator [Schumannella sp. 10F1B-5-1]|uniref:GntR family transcriptional regulator n=1 Tax=Schumannella sp. 10F1B-5-1 TaxID=2590780 RepID=UPI0011312C72|nr:GntR family transcriptional regulator [Schumannella sp. 10F1B-5-1]TPW78463.1 GntR family transcriptional regulator [Schumannella sp. 10F1B-5-1]